MLRHFFSRILIYNTFTISTPSRVEKKMEYYVTYHHLKDTPLVEVSDDFGEFVCRYAEEKLIDSSSSKNETDDINGSYSDVVMNEDNWIHLDEETIKKFTYDKIFDIVMKEPK